MFGLSRRELFTGPYISCQPPMAVNHDKRRRATAVPESSFDRAQQRLGQLPVRSTRAMGRQAGPKGFPQSLKRFGGAMSLTRVATGQMGDWGDRGGGAWRAVLLVVWPVAFDPDLELV